MKKRNVIVAALLAVAVVGASIGGYYGFRAMNRPVTMVYAVSDLSSGYWGDNMTLDGMITSDASQNIYLSTEQKVKEVLVQEGDTVREGDVLMSYDTTAKELELETMELEQKQNALKLDQAKDQLEKLKSMKPVSETPLFPGLEDPGSEDPFYPEFPGMENPGMDVPGEDPGMEEPGGEQPGEDPGTEDPGSEQPGEEPTPTPEPSYDDAVVDNGGENPLAKDAVAYKGTGTKEDPLVFLCSPGTVITGEFFNRMAGFADEAADPSQERNASFFRLEIREGDQASGALRTVWEQDGAQITEPYEADYRTVFQMGSKTDQRPEILFTEPLSSVSAETGQSVKLTFAVKEEENVVFRYQWFRNTELPAGQEPEEDGGKSAWVELPEQENRTSITLEDVSAKDQGTYMVRVTAENAYGTSTAVATACVTVQDGQETEPTVTPTPEPTITPEATPEPTAAPTPGTETQPPATTVTPGAETDPMEPSVTPVTPESTAPEQTEDPGAGQEPSGETGTLKTAVTADRNSSRDGIHFRMLAGTAGNGGTESDNQDTDVSLSGLQESYTKEELKKAIAQKETEIRDLQLNQREAEMKIRNARKDLEDQTVRATIAGVVRKVGDPEKPSQDGSAFIQVDSQQGLYVKGYVSELLLDQLVPGTMLQVSSWMTGAFATATVKEVSPYPTEEYSSYGSGAQASYYPFTALIDDGADGFQNMESVSISMTVGADDASMNAIYLSKAFIREENGQKYVYVRGEDGTLERRPVVTGKILWGSEYEIKSGLTSEDYIAFPYAKNDLEGTQTEESTLSELYNY